MSHTFIPQNFPSLTTVVHKCILHAPNGLDASEVAQLMGYNNYHTMMAELTQPDRKFDADRLLSAMSATGSDVPMHFLARQIGGVFLRLATPSPLTADLLKALAVSIKEFGEFAAGAAEVLADRWLSKPELERLITEGFEAVNATYALIKQAELFHADQNEKN